MEGLAAAGLAVMDLIGAGVSAAGTAASSVGSTIASGAQSLFPSLTPFATNTAVPADVAAGLDLAYGGLGATGGASPASIAGPIGGPALVAGDIVSGLFKNIGPLSQLYNIVSPPSRPATQPVGPTTIAPREPVPRYTNFYQSIPSIAQSPSLLDRELGFRY